MKISVIIPALNEELHIHKTVSHLFSHAHEHIHEVLVCDGGSSDATVEIAAAAGAKVIAAHRKGRAAQMNQAAAEAQGEILYFVHADTRPTESFAGDIISALAAGAKIGGFRQRFEPDSALLKFNAWFTRFNILSFRGGDQSIFITRAFFEELGGYDENYTIMEEYDLMKRAAKSTRFYLVPRATVTSARKYSRNSWLRVMLANAKAIRMFHAGKTPDEINKYYKRTLNS
jgi:rSAM/selenodomain-associated transferase 2